jgi:serine/threonine protein phosphatase PrpC
MIPTTSPHIQIAGLSHPGLKRSNNEDRFSINSYRLESDHTPVVLGIVADGIGGHQAGEVAAQMTVDTIRRQMAQFTGGDPGPSLRSAVLEAGREVTAASKDSADNQGMGSTVVTALIVGDRLYTAAVGDSRIYALRKNRLTQVTIDHTWVQEALEYGIISAEDAKDHPQSHILRRHIGGDELSEPDFRLRLQDGENDRKALANQGVQLLPGDQILLCSDGLTDLVEDMEIYNTLRQNPPQEAAESLVNLALERGGDDNVTVAIISLPRVTMQPPRQGRGNWVLAVLLGGGLLICASLAAYILLSLLR